MRAEYPHDLPEGFTPTNQIDLWDTTDCSMWRFGRRCPNTAEHGVICTAPGGRRFVLAQCSMCALEVQEAKPLRDNSPLFEQIAAILDFNPAHRERIPISDILDRLRLKGRDAEMLVATELRMCGAAKEKTNVGARWNGIRWKQ